MTKSLLSIKRLATIHEMLTPEEASICLELLIPDTVQDLKEAPDYDEDTLTRMLDRLINGAIIRCKIQRTFY